MNMSKLTLGIACGGVFGTIAVATMIPFDFPAKKAALLGAFINRFSIGFVLGAINLPCPAGLRDRSLVFFSAWQMPSSPAYAPTLAMGALGGLIIGVIVQK